MLTFFFALDYEEIFKLISINVIANDRFHNNITWVTIATETYYVKENSLRGWGFPFFRNKLTF